MIKIKRITSISENIFPIKSKQRSILNEEELPFLETVLKSISKYLDEKIYVKYVCVGKGEHHAIECFKQIIGDPSQYFKYTKDGRKILSFSRIISDLNDNKRYISEKLYNYCLLESSINDNELCKLILEEPIDELIRIYCESVADKENKELVIKKVSYPTYGFVVTIDKKEVSVTNSISFTQSMLNGFDPWMNFRNISREYPRYFEDRVRCYGNVYGTRNSFSEEELSYYKNKKFTGEFIHGYADYYWS